MALSILDAQQGSSRLDAALVYLELGLSIIPIRPDTKRPAILWGDFQSRQPTESEVTDWFTRWPDADIAVVTGAISGFVIVDADNETALAFAEREGISSPIRVKTKRGWHLWFQHPRDGKRRGPRAGINSRGEDWPKIPGLDFRGDGSYAVLPPSKGYSWAVPADTDIGNDAPVWHDWKPDVNAYEVYDFDFGALDLTNVVPGPGRRVSEWDRTKADAEAFPGAKIPTGQGNGRNERVMRYAAELILEGKFGPDLRLGVCAFMREFFVDSLPEREYEATCASVERMERINHPERFDADGHYIYRRPEEIIAKVEAAPVKRFITVDDADKLVDLSKHAEYLVEPWLKRGTIVQVHGYSGHGKSLFLQHCLYAMACGQRTVGPFDIAKFGRVLYIDLENGPGTIGKRLQELRSLYGNAGDRFSVWAPFVDDKEINFHQAATLKALEEAVASATPDVVVIDTVRSAWPGLKENAAEEWAKINSLALRLRNAGLAVILVHHSNKPGEDGLGREAGSTNQLTVLETQISVTQVFEDEEVAQRKAGICNKGAWDALRAKLPDGAILNMVMRVSYGKVREWTPMHEQDQYLGFASGQEAGQSFAVGSTSLKGKAKLLALGYDGAPLPPEHIAARLHRPLYVIREWLEIAEG